jgi:CRP/FNR family cyclic AMP-dependent transcriptional regulator
MRRKQVPRRLQAAARFDAQEFLDTSGVSRTISTYPERGLIFSQGNPAAQVFYLQHGTVKLSVISKTGREAVIGMLRPGAFFGEGCLAGQEKRMGTATATVPTTVLVIEKAEMVRLLLHEPELANRFIAHVLSRNIRIEEDLIDQLFNSSEKRLARALLLLAHYGKDDAPLRTVPNVSQEVLAEIVGTTRSRVNYFMNKFRRLGFIEYNGGITIKKSLLTVVLHD